MPCNLRALPLRCKVGAKRRVRGLCFFIKYLPNHPNPLPIETCAKAPSPGSAAPIRPLPPGERAILCLSQGSALTSAGSSPLPSRERAGAGGDRVRGLFAEVSHGERERIRSLSRLNSSHRESVAHKSLFPRFDIPPSLATLAHSHPRLHGGRLSPMGERRLYRA